MNSKFFFGIAGAVLLHSLTLTAQYGSPSYSQSNYQSSFPSSMSTQIEWLQSYEDAVNRARATSKPIVILFTGTSWCPACIRLERTVLNQPEFSQALAQKFVFLKAEFPDYSEASVMASPYKSLLDRYGVNAFPTFIVINPNGQVQFTVNYRDGSAQSYAQEFLQKMGTGSFRNQ
mgnify:CR=1 FL=1